MSTTLATKQDLEIQTLAMKQDLEIRTLAMKQDLEILTLALKQDVAIMKRDIENRFSLQDQKIDTLDLRLTVKLGSMMAVGFGVTIAVLRLWT